MKSPLATPWRLSAAAFALAAVLASCTSSTADRTAGGEDFPNTLEALGRALAESVDSSGSWNSLGEASTSPSAGLPDSLELLAARTRSILCTPDSSYGPLPDGFTYLRKTTCPEGGRVQDSLVIRLSDSLVRVLVRDSSGILGLARKIQTFVADTGDGFRLKGYAGRVRIATVATKGRWRAESELVLDAGADLDWDTESDNDLWRGGQATIRDELDTLDRWSVLPLRGGGPVYGSRTGDSGRATIDRRQILTDGAVRTETSVVMAFRHDSLNYPLRFRSRLRWNDALWKESSVFGRREDSLFLPGDTAVFLNRRRAGQDSLREEIRFLAGADPRDRSGDRLVSLASTRRHAGRSEVEVRVEAVPSSPLVSGADFTDGRIALRVLRADGDTIRFDGTMRSGVSEGRWSTRSDSGFVRLDSQGRVLGTTP